MSSPSALDSWLRDLDEAELAGLLERRADVLYGVTPRSVAELAVRLWHPTSLVSALRAMPLPVLQLLEAAQVVGDGSTRTDIADFLAGADGQTPEHLAGVNRVIGELISLAIIAVDSQGRICLPDAMAEIFPSPLGLGEPLRVLIGDLTVDAMNRILMTIGVGRQKNRTETVTALLSVLGTQANIRSILETAPPAVYAHLVTLADPGEQADQFLYDAQLYARQRETVAWAGARGLLIGANHGYGWQMPAEVARALRGPDYYAPFDPAQPLSVVTPVDQSRVESDSTAAAIGFADRALALLDRVTRVSIPSLKTGGVGARELAKLTKALGATDAQVRLVLELSDSLGLLAQSEKTVGVSPRFTAWRDACSGDRYCSLLLAWWWMGTTPTAARDSEGKTMKALDENDYCADCQAARVSFFESMSELRGATSRESAAAMTFWRQPLAHVAEQDDDELFATLWNEAEILGVIAQGSLTQLGRALLAGDDESLRTHAAVMLPASAQSARFGGDLTAFVAGAPSARVSALLDSAADRESRGVAVIWRFSPPTVRRAMDEGMTGDGLLAALAEIALTELPQSLVYLINDVARRYGKLRLASAVSCIRSDDEALLTEVAVDRKLAKLGFRRLAPTVLISDAPVAQLLTSLRAAGHFPVDDDPAEGAIELRRSEDAPVSGQFGQEMPMDLTGIGRPEPRRSSVDPSAMAAALRSPNRVEPATDTELHITELSRWLSGPEIRQLAHAVDRQLPVRISYESATGSVTERTIGSLEMIGDSIFAWCYLRSDTRVFTASRIRSVSAL
jgi:hypothetical protein